MYVDNNVGRRDAKHDNNLEDVKQVEVMKFAGQPPPGSKAGVPLDCPGPDAGFVVVCFLRH
jgi:hypothetical protein